MTGNASKRGKDPVIYGFLAGVLGVVGDEIVHWVAVYFNIARSTTGHYLSQLMFPHQPVVLSKLLLGEFTHFFAGGIMGLALLLIFFVSGSRFGVTKGIGLGLALWVLHVAIIPNLISPRPYIYRTFNEALVDMGAHLAWGAITALFLLYIFFKQSDRLIKDAAKSANICLWKKLTNNIIKGRFFIRLKR